MSNPDPVQLVSCDWLQFWCLDYGFKESVLNKQTNFHAHDRGMGTRVFKIVYEITEKATTTKSHREEPFATMCMSPHSSILAPNMVLIKMHNKVLYQQGLYERILDFLQKANLVYQAITRLDICCDFTQFACGLVPNQLLSLYRKNKLIKSGTRSYGLYAQAKWSRSQLPEHYTADDLSGGHSVQSISWGAAGADVHVKMYDKSLEIETESHKNYIKSYWRRNGLEYPQGRRKAGEVKAGDVWRVEISLARRSKYLQDMEVAEVVPIGLNAACLPSYLKDVFSALAKRHFSFLDVSKGLPKSRCRTLDLWAFSPDVIYEPAHVEGTAKPSRMFRTVSNFLGRLPEMVDFRTINTLKPFPAAIVAEAKDLVDALYEDARAAESPAYRRERAKKREAAHAVWWLQHQGLLDFDAVGDVYDDLNQFIKSEENYYRLRDVLTWAHNVQALREAHGDLYGDIDEEYTPAVSLAKDDDED